MPEQNATWTFQSIGGVDQIMLRSAADMQMLPELDAKLWAVLSCPAKGLEFDQRTLELIDTDKDGRIRVPEVKAAAAWAAARLRDPASLAAESPVLRFADIADTPDGNRIAVTARAMMAGIGKPDADALSEEDVRDAVTKASGQLYNGDGIIPVSDQLSKEVQDFVAAALAVTGGVPDASGAPGINQEIADAFTATLRNWTQWRQALQTADSPLGTATPKAHSAMLAVRDKINDWFLRCDLAAYCRKTPEQTSPDPDMPMDGLLANDVLAALPLAAPDADARLCLTTGLNPAWRERMSVFASCAAPLLAEPGVLTRADWRTVQDALAAYDKAVSSCPPPQAAAVSIAPTSTPEDYSPEQIQALLNPQTSDEFARHAQADASAPMAAADIADVERITLYHKHLYRLLINFVSFEEFFLRDGKAMFQCGTLYIDGRSCKLCTPVANVDTHSALAENSRLFLLYCACTRRSPGAEPQTMNIVAAVTAGSADRLIQSRNGVFVDKQGCDWDATVVKVVDHPISLWQAIWHPYKKIGSMIGAWISKFASDKQTQLFDSAGKRIEAAAVAATAQPPQDASAGKIDITRNVGIFAAVGLALGAIGTAVGSIVGAVVAMQWWQFPLVLAGLFIAVSGPSVLLAWLKLRQRALGPLLEAGGWAVNSKISINYMLARRLTHPAVLPQNSQRSKDDPLARERRWWRIVLAAGLAAALAGWCAFRHYYPDVQILPQPTQEAPAPAAEKPAEEKPAQ